MKTALLWAILTAIPLFGIAQLPPEYLHDIETLPAAEPLVPATTVYAPATTSTSSTSTTERTAVDVEVSPTTKGPTATSAAADGARCPTWWDTARAMGWPEDSLPILDEVMWNESRCQPDVISATNDYGLLQINWATWSHMVRDIGYTKQDLLVPAVNLLIGRLVYQIAADAGYRCGFSPWYMSGDYCD